MASEYLLRHFKDKDYPELLQLWNSIGLSKPERADTLQTIKDTLKCKGVLYILEFVPNHEMVGSSWITNDGRRLYLHHFGIKKTFQGKNLAQKILSPSLQFAKNQNLQIKLEVHKQNKIALNMYLKAGFNYLGDYFVYIIRNVKNI
jgi:ribosomal protein S18 acetylase RimI-like enzyme